MREQAILGIFLAASAAFAGDEVVPRLLVSGPTQVDGESDVAIFGIEVRGGAGSPTWVEGQWTTVACTAEAGSDFVHRSQSFGFSSDQSPYLIEVPLSTLPANQFEGWETFRVELTAVTGADVEDGVGEARLRDPRTPPHTTPGDVDGNGTADLWLEYDMASGEPRKKVIVHGLEGTGATALCEASELLHPGDWSAVAIEDVDGDGRVDVLWWHPTGAVGFSVSGTLVSTLPPCGSGFRNLFPVIEAGQPDSQEAFVGAGRFSGLGVDVVRFDPMSREIRIWAYDRSLERVQGFDALLGTSPDIYWQPIGAGDFDADGDSDLLLRNSYSGRHVVWYFDGLVRSGGGYLVPDRPATPGWIVAGTGDYNGDGHADLLYRFGDSSNLRFWFLRNAQKLCEGPVDPGLEHPSEVGGWVWKVLR